MTQTSTAERTPVGATELDRLSVVTAVVTFALVPVARGWVLWSAPGSSGDLNQWVTTSPFDWPLALLVALQLASLAEDRRTETATSLPVRFLAVTLTWMALTALVHPSWRALDLLFHLAGAWAVVRTARRATPGERTALLTAVVALGTFQALLGIAQSRTGNVLGLGFFEFDGPLYTFGSATAGRGSLTHPYHLTALLVTAAAAGGLLATRLRSPQRRFVLVAVAVMGVAIPLTFSRTALLALVPMVLLWGRRPASRLVAATLLLGLLTGGVLGLDGIAAKAERTADVDAADSGRRQRISEALELAEEEPVFGVGPGRYVLALRDVEHEDLLPPHNIVLHVTAETGVPGGILAAGTLLAFGVWVLRRRSTMVGAVAISLLPFHLLDSYPHVFPVGVLISGMWLAVLAVAVTDHEPAGAP